MPTFFSSHQKKMGAERTTHKSEPWRLPPAIFVETENTSTSKSHCVLCTSCYAYAPKTDAMLLGRKTIRCLGFRRGQKLSWLAYPTGADNTRSPARSYSYPYSYRVSPGTGKLSATERQEGIRRSFPTANHHRLRDKGNVVPLTSSCI